MLPEIESVLFIRLSSVGDIVLTEPAVAAVREALPDARIGFAVKAAFRELVSSNPDISRVHTLDQGGLRSLVEDVRSERYSAVVDLHRNVRTARIVRSSGIPTSTAYVKRERSDTVRVRLLHRPFRASRLLVRRYLDALVPLGIDAETRPPRLHVAPADASAAAALLDEFGAVRGEFAVIVPGSVWPTKRWPADRFARLASGLVSQLGLRVLLVGAGGERELCETVERDAGEGVVNLAGRTSLGETAAVISTARLFVGNDSGPTHMAVALGVPAVAIFGPTDPGQFDFSGHALVYRDLACSACSFYGGERCPLGHWDCMAGIEPAEVLRAASTLLDTGPVEGAGRRDGLGATGRTG